MKVECRESSRWWITDMPDNVVDCGPYDTKAEAEEDMRGMKRFLKYGDEPGFITTDTK